MFIFYSLIVCLCSTAFSLTVWDGPKSGPVAQPSKTVVYIASDLRNGGVSTVFRAFEQAAKILKWNIKLENGKGDKKLLRKILAKSVFNHTDGIIFAGFQSEDFPDLVEAAKKAKIALVGWHSTTRSGSTNNLFVNITTNPVDVANLAADFVLQDAKAKKKDLGVIIFNDKQFEIAELKTNTMKKFIENCKGYRKCKVLSVENIPISEASEKIPEIVSKLNSTYGKSWTYCLAINDVYFDSIHFPLRTINRDDIVLVSAGDGSTKAIQRIATGHSQQAATVAEPLKQQGFQIADELNRAFAGVSPSGYNSKPIVVTTKSLKQQELKEVKNLDYETFYSQIWNRKLNNLSK